MGSMTAVDRSLIGPRTRPDPAVRSRRQTGVRLAGEPGLVAHRLPGRLTAPGSPPARQSDLRSAAARSGVTASRPNCMMSSPISRA